MQLVRYNPRHNVISRQNNLNTLFDGSFDDFFGPAFTVGNVTGKPANQFIKVDIFEKDEAIVIEAEMAGVAKEDVQLDVKGKLVTIGGERKREEEIQKENQLRMERSSGSFSRTFSLPFDIDAESVVAKYENGILRLEIPKPAEKQRKKIEIS